MPFAFLGYSMSRLYRMSWSVLSSTVIVSVLLSACGIAPATPVKQKCDVVADCSIKVQSLERQVRERDKRIEELESKLEALKVIDQDYEKQTQPLQLPPTLAPIK